MSDFVAEYQAELKDQLEDHLPRSVTRLQAIGRALLPLIPPTTTALKVEYRGCGDEGEIVDISILPLRIVDFGPVMTWAYDWSGPNGVQKGESYQPTAEVNHSDLPESLSVTFDGEAKSTEYSAEELQELIEELTFEILYNRHPGWEISDGETEGSDGILLIAFPSLSVSLEHSAKYIASNEFNDKWIVGV